jgi:hypothetical protein
MLSSDSIYPPESALKPPYVKKIKDAEERLSRKKGKIFPSMDEFIRDIKR